ncbi:hypothetical protein ACHAXR_005271 [Thalassiosira sp. AJA248-18]
MLPIKELPAYLHEIVFKEDATAHELLTIALACSVFWKIAFAVARPLILSQSYGGPLRRCEKEYDDGGKEMLEEMGYKLSREEAIAAMLKEWVNWQVVNIQHLTGAMLCVPSLLGLGDPAWATSLAVCGVLSEMGWEIMDLTETVYKYFFTELSVPLQSIILMLFHHSLTSVLGLPMVLHYRGLKALHCLCFDLQIGAAAGILTEYSKFLNIKIPGELRQFKVVNLLLLVLMVWTRFLHWTSNVYAVLITWYHDEAWTFFAVGFFPLVAFSFFNGVFCVIPMYKRFKKFLHMSAEFESLPPDVSEKKKMQSVMSLEEAVGDLLQNEEDNVILFLESFDGRAKLARRQTMPPLRGKTTWGSTRLMRGVSVPAHVWKEE